jgi:hypothetical protein
MRPVILHFLQLILVICVDVGCAKDAGQSSSAPVIIAAVKLFTTFGLNTIVLQEFSSKYHHHITRSQQLLQYLHK